MLLWGTLAVLLTGCGTFSAGLKSDSLATSAAPAPGEPAAAAPAPVEESTPVAAPVAEDVAAAQGVAMAAPAGDEETNFGPRPDAVLPEAEAEEPVLLAGPVADTERGSALAQPMQDIADMPEDEYDPWEPFNERMFEVNRNLDRWVLKPAARAYMVVMPEPWQVLIANGFDNINFVPRFINSLLQGKWGGAGRELGRFLINSTAGIGGLFDPAKDFWGIPKSREDFGQTLGTWGSGPGPYLILPLMEPLTVRDGVGKFVDGLMDPLSYVLPFFWTRAGMKAGDTLNDRALNYDLFQGFEESVIDMYSAVRHGYLQRRRTLIKE
jgi:phospholipid-binding lipoprotein MlaA